MITRITDPLPPHSTQPYPATALAAFAARRRKIDQWALRAKAGTLCAPNPLDYLDLGPQIASDVARAPQQSTLTGQTALKTTAPSPTPQPITNAPTVVPLNVSTTALVAAQPAPRGTPHASAIAPWGNSPVVPPAQQGLNLQTLLSNPIAIGLAVALGLYGLSTIRKGR